MWSNLAVEGSEPRDAHDFIEPLQEGHHLPPDENCTIIYLNGRPYAIETVQEA
jgi:hypothetical protein